MKATPFRAHGRTWKRPTRTRRHAWRQPRREVHDYAQVRYRLITNAEDGTVYFSSHQPTDEGYSYTTFHVDFDRGEAWVESGGRDCDGPISHTRDWRWDEQQGDWVVAGSSTYDAYAQAMNY